VSIVKYTESPHSDELAAPQSIAEARIWWERANNADDGLRAAALAIWAAWFGLEILVHAESSSEWIQLFRSAIAEKDMGGLETLSLNLDEWQKPPAGEGE
jgi:hypothetical protein